VEKLAKAKTTKLEEDNQECQLTAKELQALAKADGKQARRVAKAESSAYREMKARVKQAEAMERAENNLITKKVVAGKGQKRKMKRQQPKTESQFSTSSKESVWEK
jgi:hypothetical protein